MSATFPFSYPKHLRVDSSLTNSNLTDAYLKLSNNVQSGRIQQHAPFLLPPESSPVLLYNYEQGKAAIPTDEVEFLPVVTETFVTDERAWGLRLRSVGHQTIRIMNSYVGVPITEPIETIDLQRPHRSPSWFVHDATYANNRSGLQEFVTAFGANLIVKLDKTSKKN